MSVRIVQGDLTHPCVVALLQNHVSSVRSSTARGSAHALDVAALSAPDIRFWTGWFGNEVAGCVALRRLTAEHGEVKSMHVAEAMRRRGVATALLCHVVTEARAAGLRRLSLQTGSWDFFRPAHALYARHGFVACAPFADYVEDPHSLFFSADIEEKEAVLF